MDEASPQPPVSMPASLRALWPLVQRFGISDDVERGALLEHASSEDLVELVQAVTPAVFAEINAYLDETHDAEEAVVFGDLAQAAMEAASLLSDRRR